VASPRPRGFFLRGCLWRGGPLFVLPAGPRPFALNLDLGCRGFPCVLVARSPFSVSLPVHGFGCFCCFYGAPPVGFPLRECPSRPGCCLRPRLFAKKKRLPPFLYPKFCGLARFLALVPGPPFPLFFLFLPRFSHGGVLMLVCSHGPLVGLPMPGKVLAVLFVAPAPGLRRRPAPLNWI